MISAPCTPLAYINDLDVHFIESSIFEQRSCWRHSEMARKLTGEALSKFEADRDVWQEVLESVREIKAGRGKRTKVQPASPVVQARMKSGLSQSEFAAVLGVSKRTLEQWEQGRRQPTGAARTLLRIAERHPEVLRDVAN